jgi:GNAT superfamily N-acetyltransferase
VEQLVTTYLEIRDAGASRPQRAAVSGQNFEVREQTERDWKFNREMYFEVGEQWKWIDKRPWTEAQWKQWANDPNRRTFAAFSDEALIGYYELHRDADEVEIAYFGLLPGFIGRGLGGALLTSAIENACAWAPRPSRVWVHTCNRDHPNALSNYQARGFKIYKTVTSDT